MSNIVVTAKDGVLETKPDDARTLIKSAVASLR
jgi:hypothetical protein